MKKSENYDIPYVLENAYKIMKPYFIGEKMYIIDKNPDNSKIIESFIVNLESKDKCAMTLQTEHDGTYRFLITEKEISNENLIVFKTYDEAVAAKNKIIKDDIESKFDLLIK